jgi:chromate transporter
LFDAIFQCLRMGIIGFGGPLSIIALIQKEWVQQRKWVSDEEFNRVLPLIKSMPGPVAWQTVVYMARARVGTIGAIFGGIAFIFPSYLMMLVLAQYYDSYRSIPVIGWALNGMQVAAFILIALALKPLTQGRREKRMFWILATASLALFYLGINEPILILGMGLIGVFSVRLPQKFLSIYWPLIWICIKAGGLAFGTGLAIVPLLENDFVGKLHWLTHQQFMDALAFGQLTPGPVMITVTFIGFKVAGIWGATLATFAVFFPSTFHMLTWFPKFVGWLGKQKWIENFLTGALAALSAGIVYVLINLAKTAQRDQIFVFVLISLIYFKWKTQSWALILIAGALGFVCNFAWL